MSLTAHRFYARNDTARDPGAEAAFFENLKMRNGTFKRTRPSRFTEIEKAFGPVFRERADTIRSALDIGVSSGVTSLEFLDFLGAQGSTVSLTATDLFLRAHIVGVAPGLRVLADPEGFPLQYDVAGTAIRAWVRRLDYATLAFAPLMIARHGLGRRVRTLIAQGRSRPVHLASPRLLHRRDVEVMEDDILIRRPAFAGRFDVVRAANILNLGYFTAGELESAITNIRVYLRGPGSLFLATRTNRAGGNAATLFELGPDCDFRPLKRLGGGSEIEPQVLAATIA
ncbi:ATP-binding protein [Aureimonas sp. SA4125]|uniref:ATP-binding protein n=1 Tax=Aureimonas sp. SA4125 TaxID=2826993 RepID=UPI001CC7CE73|nr:ATP-binding protein [Aureimonas sp. SA4125]BDA82965.1 ATP-binding protein [Aureimonas sp. SA4125]